MNAVLQRWAPCNGKYCVPIVFSLMSSTWAKFLPTNPSNIYYSQAHRQDFAAGGGTFLNTILNACSNSHEKSCLRRVNLIHIYLDPECYIDMNAEQAEHCDLLLLQLGQGKRQEIAYFSNRWNFYLLVDCYRVSPLSPTPLSCRTSYSISGGSLYSRNKANRRYNVAIEA